jgi:hypothetical protein
MQQQARAFERDAFARQAAAERADRTPPAGGMGVSGEFCFVLHFSSKNDGRQRS